MIIMTIFETDLKHEALKSLLLQDVGLTDCMISEDIFKKGVFAIRYLENPNQIYTVGIKNNAIWTSEFAFFVEDLLIKKMVSFTKKSYPFETPDEAVALFLQKYSM